MKDFKRLDLYIQESFGNSRNKAQELIKGGFVKVDGLIVFKPSQKVSDELIELDQSANYVSRAAQKLKSFLEDNLDFSPDRLNCLDIGSSTGGFTQILLEFGANSIVSLDIGENQLHHILRNNPKVISKEKQDVRTFISQPFDFVTCDASFISLLNILSDIDRLSKKYIVLLFKPQFEVGLEAKRDKKGVVCDEKKIFDAMIKFEQECKKLNWKLVSKTQSSVRGKEGNIEYVYGFWKN